MHYSHRHLSCYILFMSLPVLATNRAMSLSSWHSPWNGCWVWWHLAPQPFKATLRKGIENLILPLCTCLGDVWTYGGGIEGNLCKRLEFRKQTAFLIWQCQKVTHNPLIPQGKFKFQVIMSFWRFFSTGNPIPYLFSLTILSSGSVFRGVPPLEFLFLSQIRVIATKVLSSNRRNKTVNAEEICGLGPTIFSTLETFFIIAEPIHSWWILSFPSPFSWVYWRLITDWLAPGLVSLLCLTHREWWQSNAFKCGCNELTSKEEGFSGGARMQLWRSSLSKSYVCSWKRALTSLLSLIYP